MSGSTKTYVGRRAGSGQAARQGRAGQGRAGQGSSSRRVALSSRQAQGIPNSPSDGPLPLLSYRSAMGPCLAVLTPQLCSPHCPGCTQGPKYPTRQNPPHTSFGVRSSLFGSVPPQRVSPGPCTQRKKTKQFLLTKFQAKFEEVIELCFCKTFFF